MKKLVKVKNIYRKSVHNLKSKIFHENIVGWHILSKDLTQIYSELSPIYADLDNDYFRIDLTDFKYYERWLNG